MIFVVLGLFTTFSLPPEIVISSNQKNKREEIPVKEENPVKEETL